jgi:hypothetical protein
VEKIRNRFIPLRMNIVIEQLKQAGLYPMILAPVIKNQNKILDESELVFNSPMVVRLENQNSKGTIYYTLNGTDPRKTGGGVVKGAMMSLNAVNLNIAASTQIKARVLSDGQWSALRVISFINQNEDYSNLKITELHYHPPDLISGTDTTLGQDIEFLEFKNTGNNAISIGGLVLDSAVHYIFPERGLLPPRQFYVIASKPKKFFNYYGMLPSGNYQGNLSNTGEEILLNDPKGFELLDFVYDDSSPWPSGADGDGFSLSSSVINPTGFPGDYSYWTLSVVKDGTPFADNILTVPEPPGEKGKGLLTAYPNPTNGTVTLQLETDEEVSRMDLIVFSVTGKVIRNFTIGNPGLIDLASFGLPSGVYICKVITPKYSSRTAIILTK